MKHLFVPYDLSVKLKEKGFYEECFGWYGGHTKLFFCHQGGSTDATTMPKTYLSEECCLAPLYQQVVDWFRNKHKISIQVVPNWEHHKKMDGWDCFVDSIKLDRDSPTYFNGISEDYYSGLNWSIKEALKVI